MKKRNLRNRKSKAHSILTCHDELLAELYQLNTSSVFYRKISGKDYIVAEKKFDKATICLLAEIPKEFLIYDNTYISFDKLTDERKISIIYKLKEKLSFSSKEILVCNILLDKVLKGSNKLFTSFKDIEINYRRKVSSYRNVKLNNYTFNAYIRILKQLANKNIYLKTENNFRKTCYGVNDRETFQPLITLSNMSLIEDNNISFSYSFGVLGDILKKSKRFSNTLSYRAYEYAFNQSTKHVIAFFIAREIFIRRYNPNFWDRNYGNFQLTPDEIMCLVPYMDKKGLSKNYSFAEALNLTITPNKLRLYKMFIKYMDESLKCVKHLYSELILDFEPNELDENFVKNHEFDYDNNFNLQTENLGIDDITFDTNVYFDIDI